MKTILNAQSFYPDLLNEMQSAKRFIIIISPFLAINRVQSLTSDFSDTINRGVKIILITRDPIKTQFVDTSQKCIDLLRSIGVNVEIADNTHGFNEKFHEKMVFIDTNKYYSGSLNILSHWGQSTEVMEKDDDRESIKQYFQKYSFKYYLKKYNLLVAKKQEPPTSQSHTKKENKSSESLPKINKTESSTNNNRIISIPLILGGIVAIVVILLIIMFAFSGNSSHTTSSTAVCDCSKNLYDCKDFANQNEAQKCFDYCKEQGKGDIHLLDADKNGRVCE